MEYRLWWRAVAQRVKGDLQRLKGATKVLFKHRKERTRLEQLIARISGKKPPVEVPALTPGGAVAQSGKSITANAECNKSDMSMAAGTYLQGVFMGEPCVKIDYTRALDLLERSGTDPTPISACYATLPPPP